MSFFVNIAYESQQEYSVCTVCLKLVQALSPTTSAKALNAEHFEQTKSSVLEVFNV